MRWALLSELPAADRERILAAARRREFRRAQAVFREGDPADSMHLIEDGVFAVEVATRGGERSMVNVLGPGAFFGELSLVTAAHHARRTASVIALSAGQTLALGATAFAELRERHPEVERLLVAALAQRVDELSGQLLEALYADVHLRVYRRLLALADVFPDATIPLSQEDIATMAGAARPTVNQVLQRLVADGVVTLGRRQIAIRDVPALRAAAEAGT
jgi:CRP/FNR family transcriptional regulator, cyclic AMP receptor protein